MTVDRYSQTLNTERASLPTTPAVEDAQARILVVDDEPTNILVLSRLLETHGYHNIITISDPRQLLLSFLEIEPDLLLLDLHMPHLNGYDVLTLLRDWLPSDQYFPIIMLTADATPDARRRALADGASDFLTKPFDATEVLLRVKNHLQTRRLHQSLHQRTHVLEGRLTAVLDSLDQIVWTADPDGTLTYVSDAIKTVTGRDPLPDGASRAFWPEWLHPDDQLPARGWLSRLRVEGRLDLEHRIVRPDGEVRWLQTRCRLALDEAGRPLRIDGLSIDITERKRLADEVAHLMAQRERDRVTSELISTVSHELRTPLTSLLGFSELLLQPDITEAERADWTGVLHREAERLTDLVDDILDVSRIEAGRMVLMARPVDVRQVADRVLEPFLAGPERHRIIVDYPDSVPTISADPEKLGQVLTNLVANALKYSPDGGPVHLSIKADDQFITFAVSDRGLGLSPSAIEQLFQRFSRINTPDRDGIPGTGLGLYIARQMVELHGGLIWVESGGPRQGSTFTVQLPLAIVSSEEFPR
ncbi:MAG: ATP-binding protein [Chloroflexota bacterium]